MGLLEQGSFKWMLSNSVKFGHRFVEGSIKKKRTAGFNDARIGELDRAFQLTWEELSYFNYEGDSATGTTLKAVGDLVASVLDSDAVLSKYVVDVFIKNLHKTKFFKIKHNYDFSNQIPEANSEKVGYETLK